MAKRFDATAQGKAPAPGTAQTADQATSARSQTRALLHTLRSLCPLILGLAFARAGLIASCYGSYDHTDAGLFTDGAMLVGLFLLLIPFLLIAARTQPLEKPWVNRIARACIVLEVLFVTLIGATNIVDPLAFELRFALSVACTVAASGSIYYWLRRARGSRSTTAALLVFAALVVSEIELYVTYYLPTGIDCFVPAALALLQLPCMKWARRQKRPSSIDDVSDTADDFFGFAEDILKSKQLLVAFAVGIILLSIVTGYLRGYPHGEAIPFTFATRLAYGFITIGLSAAVVAFMIHGKMRAISQAIFICLEILACVALICYATFPDALFIGAVFTTSLNAMMVAFTWYVIIAFMSYGWRDPYYYAIAGWFVWLGSRALMRMSALAFQPETENNLLFFAIMGTLLVISANVINIQFLRIERSDVASEEAVEQAKESPIMRIMGIDEAESLASMRQSAMRHSAEVIGAQFLLSEREVDVLALYAQGFTQKKVAEELFITPSTAHAHIKRIYAKTGMHSRQDILDYIEKYVP